MKILNFATIGKNPKTVTLVMMRHAVGGMRTIK